MIGFPSYSSRCPQLTFGETTKTSETSPWPFPVQGDQFRGNKQVKEWKRPLLMNNVMECSEFLGWFWILCSDFIYFTAIELSMAVSSNDLVAMADRSCRGFMLSPDPQDRRVPCFFQSPRSKFGQIQKIEMPWSSHGSCLVTLKGYPLFARLSR